MTYSYPPMHIGKFLLKKLGNHGRHKKTYVIFTTKVSWIQQLFV